MIVPSHLFPPYFCSLTQVIPLDQSFKERQSSLSFSKRLEKTHFRRNGISAQLFNRRYYFARSRERETPATFYSRTFSARNSQRETQ